MAKQTHKLYRIERADGSPVYFAVSYDVTGSKAYDKHPAYPSGISLLEFKDKLFKGSANFDSELASQEDLKDHKICAHVILKQDSKKDYSELEVTDKGKYLEFKLSGPLEEYEKQALEINDLKKAKTLTDAISIFLIQALPKEKIANIHGASIISETELQPFANVSDPRLNDLKNSKDIYHELALIVGAEGGIGKSTLSEQLLSYDSSRPFTDILTTVEKTNGHVTIYPQAWPKNKIATVMSKENYARFIADLGITTKPTDPQTGQTLEHLLETKDDPRFKGMGLSKLINLGDKVALVFETKDNPVKVDEKTLLYILCIGHVGRDPVVTISKEQAAEFIKRASEAFLSYKEMLPNFKISDQNQIEALEIIRKYQDKNNVSAIYETLLKSASVYALVTGNNVNMKGVHEQVEKSLNEQLEKAIPANLLEIQDPSELTKRLVAGELDGLLKIKKELYELLVAEEIILPSLESSQIEKHEKRKRFYAFLLEKELEKEDFQKFLENVRNKKDQPISETKE